MSGKEGSAQPDIYLMDLDQGDRAAMTTSSLVAQLAQTAAPPKSEPARNSFERYAMVAARILLAMIFIMNALNIIGQTLAEHEMAAHGVPFILIPVLILSARALQLIAGLGLILGIYPRLSALGLLLFLIPATLMAHDFWFFAGTSLYTVQMINFFKNVCMAGGLLFIIASTSQPVLLSRPLRAN